ncbi:MAG: hypothetical protein CMJ25_18965 [Phycisphaerae bacterium]|nr:hypothetical protein [Phycisphaerae bacterium]
MAKAVKAAVTIFVVTFAVMSGAIFVFGTAGVGGAAATLFGVTAMEMAALSAISTLVGGLMSKGIKATASENFGNKVATRTATAPRQIIYGKARVGGTITHIETSGTDNYKLSMIVVLAGHEVESLEDVLINDEILTTTSSGGFQYATNSKFVNADNENKFGVQSSLLRYVFVDGSQTTANSTVVNNTSLTSSDKFIGMSYMLIEMVVDSEAFGGGIPPMAFVVKGKKVYDPRTSSTAWSDNPALCVRDYITNTTYGLKATSSEVLDTTALGGFASAANTCDSGNTIGTATVNGATSSSIGVTVDTSSTLTLIDVGQTVTGTGISGVVKVVRRRGLLITLSSAQTIADGVTLTFTEELYTANGITNMSASGSDVIQGLLSSCAGKLSYIDGKFVMFAGASVTPDMTITDDNLLAPISVVTKQSSGESFNTVKAVYVDANNNYIATDSPVYTDSTFLSNDTPTGESSANYRKSLEIQLPFTDTTTMAQRLQRTALLHTRKELSLSVLCNIAYMQLQPFDWVYLTNERLGFTNKTFEVLSTNLEVIESDDVPVLATRLALKEIDSSVYAFASSSYTSPIDEGTSVSTGSFSVTAPTNLSVSATLINTGYDLQVQWTNNPDDLIQGTEILYGTSSGTYIGSLIAGKGKTKEIIPNVKANSVYYIVARHFSANNVFSANTSEVNINTSSGTGIATPSAPTSLSATTGKPLSIGLSWSNPSNSDLRDIKIYRATSSGFTPNDGTNLVRTIAGVPSATQKVSFGIDDGLADSTTYYFKVKAVSFFDKESSASNQASGSFTKVEATDIVIPNFSGYFHVEGSTTTALSDSAFNTAHGRLPFDDDILIMVNTSASPKVSKAYKYSGTSGSGGSFVEITNFTTGDLVVDGTIAGAKVIAGSIDADRITAGTITSASGVFGSISANDIDTGTLNAANVTVSGGDVIINNSGIAINGSSSSINLGSGAFIVASNGALTATSATITGAITATSGSFTGSITATSLNVTNATITGTLDASAITLGDDTLDNVLAYSETGGIGLLSLLEGASVEGDFVVDGDLEAIGQSPELVIGKSDSTVPTINQRTQNAYARFVSTDGYGGIRVQKQTHTDSSPSDRFSITYSPFNSFTTFSNVDPLKIYSNGGLSLTLDNQNATFTGEVTADALALPSQTPSTTTNKLYNVSGSLYFNGSAVGGGGTGDITSVGAGTNLNGGGTSGAVTLNLDTALTGLTSIALSGNMTVTGTVDGRDIATDGTKLDGIEANATADQTNAEIRAAVEAATNSNVFTDADHNKLNAIEANADVTDTANVTSAGALMDNELSSIADVKAINQSVVSGATPTFTTTNFTDATNKRFMTDAQETKLDSVESGATADQTQAQINALGITAIGLSGSPNITVGTISSGAVTSSGAVKGTEFGSSSTTASIDYKGHNGKNLISAVDGAAYYYGSDSGDYGIVIQSATPICRSLKIGTVNAGTTVIDSSLNMSNIGTISSGEITSSGNVTAFSDKRLKTNIQTLDSKKALQMRGVRFIKDGVEGSGVIAQEIEEISPELVMTADDEMGTKSVAYGNLVGYLIETVKDQQKQIDELKQRLDNDS